MKIVNLTKSQSHKICMEGSCHGNILIRNTWHIKNSRLYLYLVIPITTNEYSLRTRDFSTFVHLLHQTMTICNPSLPYWYPTFAIWLINDIVHNNQVGALQCPRFEQALHEKHYETDPNVKTVKLVSLKSGALVTLLKIIAFPHNLSPPKPSLYNGTPNIQNQLEIIFNHLGSVVLIGVSCERPIERKCCHVRTWGLYPCWLCLTNNFWSHFAPHCSGLNICEPVVFYFTLSQWLRVNNCEPAIF